MKILKMLDKPVKAIWETYTCCHMTSVHHSTCVADAVLLGNRFVEFKNYTAGRKNHFTSVVIFLLWCFYFMKPCKVQ